MAAGAGGRSAAAELAARVIYRHRPQVVGGHHSGQRTVCSVCWSHGGGWPCETAALAAGILGDDADENASGRGEA
jgi:hypothetical protein